MPQIPKEPVTTHEMEAALADNRQARIDRGLAETAQSYAPRHSTQTHYDSPGGGQGIMPGNFSGGSMGEDGLLAQLLEQIGKYDANENMKSSHPFANHESDGMKSAGLKKQAGQLQLQQNMSMEKMKRDARRDEMAGKNPAVNGSLFGVDEGQSKDSSRAIYDLVHDMLKRRDDDEDDKDNQNWVDPYASVRNETIAHAIKTMRDYKRYR